MKATQRQGYYKKFFLLFWLFIVFLFYKGYDFGIGNQAVFIPSLYRIANPDFLKGDWYIASLVPYHYLFKLFYAKLLSFAELSVLFFYSYYIAIILYILSLKRISRILFKENGPFYILFTFLMIWPTNGIEQNALIYKNYFESLVLAIPLVIFSISYFLEDKIVLSFIIAGIVSILHLSIGVNLFVILIFCYLILNIRKPKLFYNIAFPIFCYLVISAWTLAINHRQIAVNSHYFIDYVRFRLPHHFILSSWGGSIASFFWLLFLGGIALINKPIGQTDRKIMVFSFVILAGMAIQYVFIEIIPVDLIAKFQFFRMSIFISLVAFLYIANYLYGLLNGKKYFSLFLAIIIGIYSQNILLLAALFFLSMIMDKKEVGSSKSKFIYIAFILASLISDNIFNKGNVSRNIFGLTGLLMIAIVAGGLLYLGYVVLNKAKMKSYQLYHLPLIILTISIFSAQLGQGICNNIKIQISPQNDWEKICFWIKENTPSGAFFIIPPYREGFHLYAQRRELVDFKSNPFEEEDILEWKRRLGDVLRVKNVYNIKDKGFLSYDFMKKRYILLSEEEIKILARKYNADYIIFEKTKQLPWEIVYENNQYLIYKIPLGQQAGISH